MSVTFFPPSAGDIIPPSPNVLLRYEEVLEAKKESFRNDGCAQVIVGT